MIDWKHGRQMELLSQAEVWWYYILRWDDNVVDIREQYPLALDETLRICDELGFIHPGNRNTHMTTDFLVTYRDGSIKAFSVKTDRTVLENPRDLEKLYIEKEYWNRTGIPFQMLYKSDVSRTTIHNIMDVVSCYDIKQVYDDFSLIRYMIAHKQLIVDMGTRIDYQSLIGKYIKVQEHDRKDIIN